ncbi:cyanase [Marinobacter sp. ANT_B65]|uniref:cyanase n=1 Tax=Marinobacter sp. ANT_B65 TaxID=2039467 RepID=UPI000BBE69DA|nr:cyanase [Marinobacter sp. ANT_B65]PCM44431.1 cyanase [Marinobacter sp. ANT_B65]
MRNLKAEILASKAEQKLSWEAIGEHLGMSPVFVCSACMGMNSFPVEKAKSLCDLLGLGGEAVALLVAPPAKDWDRDVPTDPCIYRLYEIVGVYGETLKALIHEKFGDGIMSAIDFEMELGKIESEKGDRVQITMSGKYLAYNRW